MNAMNANHHDTPPAGEQPLARRTCEPCAAGGPALSPDAAAALQRQLGEGWALGDAGKTLAKTYTFKGYDKGLAFVNGVAGVAKDQDHHPDIEFSYNTVRVRWSTHSVGGLSENDFICAAKCDEL